MEGNEAVLKLRVRRPEACIDRDWAIAGPGIRSEVSDRLMELAHHAGRSKTLVVELTVVEALPALSRREVEAFTFALRSHFRQCADRYTQRITRNYQYARFSTLTGLICVVTMIGGAQAVPAEAGSLMAGVRESLTIFAWVAMWKPAELWLYAHWPERHRRRLTRRLANARVVVKENAVPPPCPAPGSESPAMIRAVALFPDTADSSRSRSPES